MKTRDWDVDRKWVRSNLQNSIPDQSVCSIGWGKQGKQNNEDEEKVGEVGKKLVRTSRNISKVFNQSANGELNVASSIKSGIRFAATPKVSGAKLAVKIGSSTMKWKRQHAPLLQTAGAQVVANHPVTLTPNAMKYDVRTGVVCPSYAINGICRQKRCIFKHDPQFKSLCPSFLQAKCNNQLCPLSHSPNQYNMPVCIKFLCGFCDFPNCLYSHVSVGEDAPNCDRFALKGVCERGNTCQMKHTRLRRNLRIKNKQAISQIPRLKKATQFTETEYANEKLTSSLGPSTACSTIQSFLPKILKNKINF